MSKKCYRFFGGLLNAQAKWLNKMSEKGYRLVRTGRVLYEFEECSPDEVTYCVEFIGEKSKENATDYADFLEDMGYKVFFKNINLNYSPAAPICTFCHYQAFYCLGYFFIGFCNSQHFIPAPNYKCPTKSQNVGTINNNQEGDNKSCRPLDYYL